MRLYLGLFVVAIVSSSVGCKPVEETSGTTSSTGSGGGGGGTTTGGNDGPCGAVPVEGECIGTTGIRSCFVHEEAGLDPEIVEVQCQATEACEIVNGTATCKLQGDCYPGSSQCKDSTTLQTCNNGAWVETACGGGSQCLSQPGAGAECAAFAPGSGIFLGGHLEYEFRRPASDLSDFSSTLSQEPAVDFFVTVYDNGQLIGLGLTSPGGNGLNPGDWQIELDSQPTDQTFVYFWPMLFDNNGQPRMAMAHAQSTDPLAQSSDTYWSWGFGPVCPTAGPCGVTDMGPQLIDEASGSGAAHISQWVDSGIFRLADLVPRIQPLTVAVFWEPNNAFTCGNCFVPPVGGGADVLYDPSANLSDHYQSSINMSGTDGSPSHWAKSVINHEFGHWVTSSYSKSPGEGGQHFVNQASIPGLAFSEGWATFTGQSQISNSPDDPDPIYFTKQKGTVFWVNVGDGSWSGGDLELPDPNGPLDQNINENIVTAMLWSLWSSNAGASLAPQGLGDGPLFQTLPSQRLVGGMNRGYFRLDLVDYFDAMKCEGLASGANIGAASDSVGYPYDNAEICP